MKKSIFVCIKKVGMEKLWNRNYIKVMITNFTLFFSFYLLTPLLPLYLSETFTTTKDTIGLVLSGYTLMALIFRSFSGFMVDNFPRKKVLLVCLCVYSLVFTSYLVAGSLLLFAIFRTIHGGPFGASAVANNTVAIDVLPRSRRSEGIGLYGLSNNIASAIAPTIGIFLYKYVHDFDILFCISFIVAGIGFTFASTIKMPSKEESVAPKRAISLDSFFLVRGWMLALNMVYFGYCWGVLSNYLAIYGKEQLGITNGTGIFFLILSSGLILSRLASSKSLREGNYTNNASMGIILSTIGYTLFIAWPTMVGYYVSALFIGLGNGRMWPAFQNMILAIAHSNERGTANSTILTSWDLGLGLGILFGGTIAEYFGYSITFWVTVCVHATGLLLFLLGTKKFFQQRKLV